MIQKDGDAPAVNARATDQRAKHRMAEALIDMAFYDGGVIMKSPEQAKAVVDHLIEAAVAA